MIQRCIFFVQEIIEEVLEIRADPSTKLRKITIKQQKDRKHG